MNVPSRKRDEIGKYALCYGTQAARKRIHNMNLSKALQITGKKNYEGPEPTEDHFNKPKLRRTSTVNDKVMLKIKEAIIGIRLTGVATSQ